MANVFISYARRDKARVMQLASALEAAGLSVWWDADLTPGGRYRTIIAEQLAAAECVVVVWTAAALQSDWVQDEAEEGRQRGVLVPVVLEPVRPPAGFRQVQAADLSQWTGSPQQPEFQALVLAARRLALVAGQPGRPQPGDPIAEMPMPPRAAPIDPPQQASPPGARAQAPPPTAYARPAEAAASPAKAGYSGVVAILGTVIAIIAAGLLLTFLTQPQPAESPTDDSSNTMAAAPADANAMSASTATDAEASNAMTAAASSNAMTAASNAAMAP